MTSVLVHPSRALALLQYMDSVNMARPGFPAVLSYHHKHLALHKDNLSRMTYVFMTGN